MATKKSHRNKPSHKRRTNSGGITSHEFTTKGNGIKRCMHCGIETQPKMKIVIKQERRKE